MKPLLTGLGIGTIIVLAWLALGRTSAPSTAPPPGGQTTPDSVSSGLPQRVRGVNLEGPFTFAGETIPVEEFDVRERLDAELLRNAYFHRSTVTLLKRRARYFPTIERILAEEGVPEDLKYLAVAESALSNATSVAGAKGVWQFMSPTARSFGLEVNEEVDERYHLEKATRAACTYLKDYYRQFGDWRWVAVAYNMGGPNVKKWRDRQRADSVFDLDINKETMAYLFRIVALKTILEDPAAFGYQITAEEAYPPLDNYRTVTISQSIKNLGDFAKQEGTTYRKLKIYNPWLVSGSLTISKGNSYEIKIPT